MIKKELANEANRAFVAMEMMDSKLSELHNKLSTEEYAELWLRWQDVCSSIYRMSTKAHELERYEFTDNFFKPIGEVFPQLAKSLQDI